MEITKREVIVSIAIISLMLILGFIFSGDIRERNLKKIQTYNQALKIEESEPERNTELLNYGIRTNVDNAFIYGDVIALEPVIHDSVEYGSITRVREKYTAHTSSWTDSKGVRHTTTTWTWDKIDEEKYHSKKLKIVGIEFPWEVLGSLPEVYLETTDAGYHLRDVWYVSNIKNTGTLYGNLGNIKHEYGAIFTKFYANQDINSVIKRLENAGNYSYIFFWIGWIILTTGIVVVFYYIDNKWLE